MTTQDVMVEDVYARPSARFAGDGGLEVRASAATGCRRGLWYAATGHRVTDPPTPAALTVLEAGNALEPVVLRAMERAGWRITPAERLMPVAVTVRFGDALAVSGHVDAVGVMPVFGGETVVEVKTRNPEAFRRWQTLGAERSHPGAVAQAAVYTAGRYGETRDAVIAAMDTGSRAWDFEVIPSGRVAQALAGVEEWLAPLTAHHAANGRDPEALPERDFRAGSWQCAACPYVTACRRDAGETAPEDAADDAAPVTEAEALAAVAAYAEAHEALKAPEGAKREALDTLQAWMAQQGSGKEALGGRTVSLVRSRRYTVDYRRLNAALPPEVRAGIVTEQESRYVRVT
ncbi:MAG: hypothetical protein OXH94_08270 [Rhodospirillales bacterium]|nr:hypothetical protein [Rhodospirillales bacterium]